MHTVLWRRALSSWGVRSQTRDKTATGCRISFPCLSALRLPPVTTAIVFFPCEEKKTLSHQSVRLADSCRRYLLSTVADIMLLLLHWLPIMRMIDSQWRQRRLRTRINCKSRERAVWQRQRRSGRFLKCVPPTSSAFLLTSQKHVPHKCGVIKKEIKRLSSRLPRSTCNDRDFLSLVSLAA